MDTYDRPMFFHLMAYAADADRDVIDMVSGNPDWEPPAALREGFAEYADADVSAYQYPPSDGLVDLREEIATRRGVDVERVVVTNGAGEANYLATACALAERDGTELLLTDPGYPYYHGRAGMLEVTPRFVPTDRDGDVDADAVRAATSDETAAIVVNTPNNPTGAVYDRSTMQGLVDVAESVDAALVVDEVYDHFVYEPDRFESALTLDSEHVVVTNSFSKSMAITGLRVGYAVLPQWLQSPVRTRHMLVNVAGARPSQHAVLRALRETPASYYETNRRRMRKRIDAFCTGLEAAGASFTRPAGGFYVLARFEDYPGTLENAERLVDEAGVAGMPGDAFGDARRDWLRFALVTPRVEAAAERLAAFFA